LIDDNKNIPKENFMRSKLLSVAVLAFTVSALAANKIQPLNTRLGLWEMTTTITTRGAMPIPDGMLAKMTPEQRARMEARMKASSAGSSRTTTRKECLTKEKQEKGETFSDNDRMCKITILDSTSTKVNAKMICNGEGINAQGTFQLEVLSPERVAGASHAVMTGNSSMNVDGKIIGKWLGSDCGNVK
jgi:hypothetical protein